ncbi:fumarate hydratase FumD [Salmonella enterica]|nr:fumarate hydratase FumD [Salmonella enterica]ELM2237404.1 fumarate hydratase FumD [Salmonella enterica]ELX2804458.1 fumarate hydratase FumD [Salmonella enterica]
MKSEELAQLRYQEMCRIVGDVVFAMVAEGHETKRVAIADVIRTELSKGMDKWDIDQIQVMELAVKLLGRVGIWVVTKWRANG